MEYNTLFSPMKIGKLEVKNRIVMAPMGADVSNHDGSASEKTVAYYRNPAQTEWNCTRPMDTFCSSF